jgi:hypothetical protein
VRRLSIASPDSGAESPVYGEEPSAAADRDPAAKPPWAGGGGRWSAWPVRPVTAILFDKTPPSGSGTGNDTTPGTAASGFAVALGEAFAFRQVYLNYNSSTAAQRAQQLAAFIPASVRAKDPQFGWNGSGTSVAQSTEVAGIDVRSADTAAVTLFSSVNGKPIELGVPLYAPDGGSDQAAKDALASQLPGFFRAFASGDQAALGRYLAPGASISGLGGAVSFGGIASLQVPRGGATREITVTVDWTIPGQVGTGAPSLVATYDVSVVDQQGARWYVKDIRASTQPMGTP